jgi:ABC-type phosphate transport system substrate-binding protein
MRSFFFWLVASLSLLGSLTARAQKIEIAGGSAGYAWVKTAAEESGDTAKNVALSVKLSGSAAALRKFCGGKIAIASTSRPISSSEMSACLRTRVRFVELVLALVAIAVVLIRV